MKLIEVAIKKFRNIIDSNTVKIEDDITCLVGKNESGKTSFLHALYRLNPVRTNAKFVVEDNYPAWLEKKDKMQGLNLNEVEPVTVKFQLESDDIKILKDKFGDILEDDVITLSKSYENTLSTSINYDENKYIKWILKELSFSKDVRSDLTKCASFIDLKNIVEGYEQPEESNEKEQESIDTLKERLKNTIGENDCLNSAIFNTIKNKIPKFIYFDKYSGLPYTVKIKEILEASEDNLTNEQLTARSLLRMAAADDDYLLNPDYERRKRELENIANALTQDVLNYWSQNPDLRVNPDITQKTITEPNGQTTVIDELKIRIWDNKHFLSLPFTEHSTGFQWFFSFLAAFSEFEYSNEPIIILLDEPGLGLHGKAQADFLRFIEERLVIKRQVLYTTHSPFMVQPNHLERTRLVEEKDRDSGSKITAEVSTTDPDTLFPLQGALGYDLAQHLFISKNNLVLEGTSDFTYIQIISDFLKEQNRSGLLDEWTLVPVGGADLIPTFVALLGIHLDITVIIDARKEGNQKLSNLAHKGYLNQKRIITLNEITKTKLADIEDIFTIDDYLKIYNEAFGEEIKKEDLTGTDQIVNKIARFKAVSRFNHGKPADYFLRNRDKFLDSISDKTLENFETLFERVNSTFEK
ncbi:AAA family ATPase [bacterium]|nr:AAA family ATPase [bacterium]